MSLKLRREIEQKSTEEEWKQLKKNRIESTFKLGRGGIIKAEFVGLLPIGAAGSFITIKLNVIDDEVPLLLGIEVIEKLKMTLDFPNNLLWTTEKGFQLTRSLLRHRTWRVKVVRQKLQLKQRIRNEEKVYWTERICNEEIEKKRIKNIHTGIGHASKK